MPRGGLHVLPHPHVKPGRRASVRRAARSEGEDKDTLGPAAGILYGLAFASVLWVLLLIPALYFLL